MKEQIVLAGVIRRHKTFQRGMRYGGATSAQNMRTAARTILLENGYSPAIREPIAAIKERLGCTEVDAIVTSLDAVPVP